MNKKVLLRLKFDSSQKNRCANNRNEKKKEKLNERLIWSVNHKTIFKFVESRKKIKNYVKFSVSTSAI